jgi:predicted enzyme related to lactoylglutathione lyase
MQFNKPFPLIITDDLDAVRRFYVKGLGWKATYDIPEYLQVRSGPEDGPELAFMKPSPFAPDTFDGRGVIVSVETDDADAHHELMRSRGLEPAAAPEDRPWGWRSYPLRDPSGVVLDVFHVLEAKAQTA